MANIWHTWAREMTKFPVMKRIISACRKTRRYQQRSHDNLRNSDIQVCVDSLVRVSAKDRWVVSARSIWRRRWIPRKRLLVSARVNGGNYREERSMSRESRLSRGENNQPSCDFLIAAIRGYKYWQDRREMYLNNFKSVQSYLEWLSIIDMTQPIL